MDFELDHIVLNVSDMEEMLRFYTEVLELPTERLQAYRDGRAPFPSVRINKATIIDFFPRSMWQEQSPDNQAGHRLNHFCLTLPTREWEEFTTVIRNRGVIIETGPVQRWGAHGTGISVYFRDPEDTLIEVRHYPEITGDPETLTS